MRKKKKTIKTVGQFNVFTSLRGVHDKDFPIDMIISPKQTETKNNNENERKTMPRRNLNISTTLCQNPSHKLWPSLNNDKQ